MNTSESKARRAAAKVGLVAKKSRVAIGLNNKGGFMLIEPSQNIAVNGWTFDMEPEEVVQFCQGYLE